MTPSVFGCEVIEVLHSGDRSVVYRAHRPDRNGTCVIKTGKVDALDAAHARRLRRERELLVHLAGCEGVIECLGLESEAGRLGLLLADFEGRSLRKLGLGGSLSSEEFLSLALKLVAALEGIHARHVVHRDLHPGNVLLSPERGTLRLIDFGSAAQLTGGVFGVPPHGTLEGTLAYLAPEQTGRVNRGVDYRADYYSLGVTLFELLTGVLPFALQDPLELVHAHIARQAPSPLDLNPAVPPILAKIVLKLLAKDADERYQSARALRADLERGRVELLEGRHSVDFRLAAADRAEGFRLPQRLYGRDRELASLCATFDQVCAGSAAVAVVGGAPGVGKSRLVKEMAGHVNARRGHFTSAKYEQYKSSVPFAALGEALDEVAQQILTESSENIAQWRARLLSALSGAGRVLSELCPSFELVLGPQPEVAVLSPSEAAQRLRQVMTSTASVLATRERPLCVFMDDMQWASPGSLQVFKYAMQVLRELPVMVVGAVRSNELAADHPLWLALAEVEQMGVCVQQLQLEALSECECQRLVADTLGLAPEAVCGLSKLVHARTSGNPFFARAFLQSLQSDGLLSGIAEGLEPELDSIRQRGVTDNVVDLLVERVSRLPGPTQEVLRIAACLGGQFDLGTLSLALGRAAGMELWPALVQELVLPLENVHSEAELFAEGASVRCRFAHDRIQQAIVSLLSDTERAELHLRVGRSLRSSAATKAALLFEATRHLNQALPLLRCPKERHDLAVLDLQAARESMKRAAGAEASSFALAGIAALGGDGFDADYELAHQLHLTAAESAFEWADHATLDGLVQRMVERARSALDAARAQRLRGRMQQSQGQSREAIRTYLKALDALGYTLPEAPTTTEIQDELRDTARCLRGREIEELLSLPDCSDPTAELAMELLSKLIFFAYASVHELLPVAVCRLVRASVTSGNSAESANGYTFYGLLLSRDHDLDRAHRFGRVAIELSHHFGNAAVLSQTYLYANYLLMHWKLPLASLAAEFRKAHEYGLLAGSPLNAACSATTLSICRFWSGAELTGLAGEMIKYRDQIVRFRLRLVLNWHEVLLQVVHNLSTPAAGGGVLCGPYYDEALRVPLHVEAADKSALFNYYVAKTLLCYLLGDYEEALRCADASQPLVPLFATAFWAVPVAYLDALTRLSMCDRAPPERRSELVCQAEQNIRKLRGWCSHKPAELAQKLAILEAELSRVQGDLERASHLFARATELVPDQDSPLDEGIAYELRAKHELGLGQSEPGRVALHSAREAFARWGALAKVKQLEQSYAVELRTRSNSFLSFVGRTGNVDVVDVLGAMHASHAISSEIRLDRLLQRLMELLVESAGADIGYLLLEKGGSWVVEVGWLAERGVVTTLESLPLSELGGDELPGVASSVVHYVASTAETVLLGDASKSQRFGADPHLVVGRRAASVLCFPLRRMGATRAIVYLENTLSRQAFSQERVKILELLSSQAVISLENARLYEELEQKVERRTRELLEKNVELGRALAQVTEMQRQLVTQEKLAALGALTAGIAHEIKNPLNFITNFADVSVRLSEEVETVLEPELDKLEGGVQNELGAVLGELRVAVQKIGEHGARATAIINGMAAHARGGSGPREPTQLNALLSQSVALVCHALGAHRPKRSAEAASELEIRADYDAKLEPIEVVPQDISRVFVNLINNARYAVEQKQSMSDTSYVPQLSVSTRDLGSSVEVRVRDNGVGIPQTILDKIFVPFFTTKAAGQGTGLGLSISHDIVVRGHSGELHVESREGEYTEFVLRLPRKHGASERTRA